MTIVINGTTGISGVDGSAGTPSYVGADTDTGLWYPAANTLALSTGGSERLRVDSSGNVGIGTSSPFGLLTAKGSNGQLTLANGNTSGGTKISSFVNAGNANGYLAFEGYSAEYARFDSSGNLLIGVTALTTGFSGFAQLVASGSSGGIIINSTAGNICRLVFAKGNSNGNEGLIRYDTSNYSMQFWTDETERMRITSGGNLLVGTTAGSGNLVLNNKDGQNFGYGFNLQKNGNGNPNYELVVGGDNKLYLGYSGNTTPSAIGNFATNGTYTATSDIRKKKDISYTFNGLSIVSQLKPVQGRMLDDEESSPLRPMFIAQDMVNVLPSVVSSIEPSPSTDNPLLGIDYSSIIPILTKAIQEQQAMIEELKAKVAALEK